MSISVPITSWGPRIRTQVQRWSVRWPTFSWGTYSGHDPSEALATDGMVPGWQTAAGRKAGQQVADAIWAERKDNGIWYVIWNGRIISTTRPEQGWLPYFARNNPNPSKSHKNHVHVSWHSDSAAPTSSSAPAKPKPTPFSDGWVPPKGQWVFYLDKQDLDVRNSVSIWLIQRALGIKPRTGDNSQELRDAVKVWQRDVAKNDPKYCDGILGPNDAKMLFNDAIKIDSKS